MAPRKTCKRGKRKNGTCKKKPGPKRKTTKGGKRKPKSKKRPTKARKPRTRSCLFGGTRPKPKTKRARSSRPAYVPIPVAQIEPVFVRPLPVPPPPKPKPKPMTIRQPPKPKPLPPLPPPPPPPVPIDIETKYVEGDDGEAIPVDPRWYRASNFSDLIALNKEFIKGKLSVTPYHFGPLETDDKKFKNKLLKLHEYGLLTDNGQDSNCTYGEYIKEGKTEVMGKHKPAYYVDEERHGYVDFFVDLVENEFMAVALAAQIMNSDLVYSIYDFYTKKTRSNIPTTEEYNVTRERAALTKEALQQTPWELHSNLPAVLEEKYLLWDDKHLDSILKHTMKFHVILPEYCKGELESRLLKMCKEAAKMGKDKIKKYK